MAAALVASLVLGLSGSLGHCFGMCGGISLMLGSAGSSERRISPQVVIASFGRVTTYTFLGVGAGIVGEALVRATPGMRALQGIFALIAAGFALYTAFALVGKAPSPDLLLTGLTKRWGLLMEGVMRAAAENPFMTGLLWGFLPCGLVLVALVGAASTVSPLWGGLVMLIFGLGTLPAVISAGAVGKLVKRRSQRGGPGTWQLVAAGFVVLLGVQIAMRGLAAWGVVDHFAPGGIVLW